jgi:hypothetical protein
MKQNDDVWCVAQGEAATSALAWTSKGGELQRGGKKTFFILLSTTNKMQRYTIFFIIVNALHVSDGFSAHHQELKNFTHSICYMPGSLAATASVVELELNHASGSSKQAWHIPDAVCIPVHIVEEAE